MTTSMRNVLLSLLAVAAVAVVVVAVVENTPERRMDRRYDRLLRLYKDDPEQLYQRVFDDRDLLGFFLVRQFLMYKALDRCDCGARTAPDSSGLPLHQRRLTEVRALAVNRGEDLEKICGRFQS